MIRGKVSDRFRNKFDALIQELIGYVPISRIITLSTKHKLRFGEDGLLTNGSKMRYCRYYHALLSGAYVIYDVENRDAT